MLARSMEAIRVNETLGYKVNRIMDTRTKHLQFDDLMKDHQDEDLKIRGKQACGLCEKFFSLSNLPVSVTVKAIYDLRHKFLLRHEVEATEGTGQEIAVSPPGHPTGTTGTALVQGQTKRLAKLIDRSSSLQATHVYDSKHICNFCAQFFRDDEVYRPSFDKTLHAMKEDLTAKVAPSNPPPPPLSLAPPLS